MLKVSIVTDSLACLPKELVEKHGIFVVPSSIVIGDRVYLDGIDIAPGAVYELQRRSKVLPTTSAASPGDLLKVYRAAAEKAPAILYVCITRSLTMAYDSALKAREMALKEMPGVEIEVLDCGTAAGAQGFLAIAAAKVANAGGTLAEAHAEVERLMPRVQLYVTVDTLYFLAKSGRVPKVAAWASSLLSIKPILQISRGEATPVERVRTKPRAKNRLLEIMREKVGNKPVHVNLVHAGVPEEAEALKRQVLSQFDCVQIYVSEFSPVMGAHTGPGLLGFAFYAEE